MSNTTKLISAAELRRKAALCRSRDWTPLSGVGLPAAAWDEVAENFELAADRLADVTDEDFLLRLASRPSWAKDRDQLLRIVIRLGEGKTMTKPLDALTRLYDVATVWQTYNRLNRSECVHQATMETCEFFEAHTRAGKLDELGDVVVNAMRALSTLSPSELQFLTLVMEMKLRRTGASGVKNKEIEAEITAKLAKELL